MLVTQKEYAIHKGVSNQRISVLVANGKLSEAVVKIPGQAFPKIDLEKADELWEKNIQKGRGKSSQKTQTPKEKIITTEEEIKEQVETIDKAKIVKDSIGIDSQTYSYYQKVNMAYMAALRKLEHDEKIGILIDKKETLQKIAKVNTAIRNKIMGIHDRIGHELGAEAAVIAKKIIWDSLKEISEMPI